MKHFLSYLFFAYIALASQAIFFRGPRPDFILVLTCFYALKFGRTQGITFGAAAGLLVDAANGFILGPHMIGKSFSAFFIRSVRENIFQWNIMLNTIMITLLTAADILIVYVCLKTFANMSFVNRPWEISLMETVYTVAAALIMYPVFRPEREVVNKPL